MVRFVLGLLLLLYSTRIWADYDVSYAESVAISGHGSDSNVTFDVRIARFPSRARGSLWFYVYVGGHTYSLVMNDLSLVQEQPTDVDAGTERFSVAGSAHAEVLVEGRHTTGMRAELAASARLHATAHPEPGEGVLPVTLNVTFEAGHAPVSVRPGRLEVMGRVRGTLDVAGKQTRFNLLGKWHEQTGSRPSFAPAFTYLFVQAESGGIMAVKHAAGAWGYLAERGQITPVGAMTIDAYGASDRQFVLLLDDGRRVRGTASVLREVSVPIEGQRRPGATVKVVSDHGNYVGVLNDWAPSSASE